jgi:hypothetical protein
MLSNMAGVGQIFKFTIEKICLKRWLCRVGWSGKKYK